MFLPSRTPTSASLTEIRVPDSFQGQESQGKRDMEEGLEILPV